MDLLTEELLAARDGDVAALTAVLRSAKGDVWRYAAAVAGPDAADDVTQDTLIRIWQALPAYRATGPGRPWILAIARHAIADAQRRAIRVRRLKTRLAHDRSAARAETPDCTGMLCLMDAIAQLAPEQRDALGLTQVVGCTYEEAAVICDVPIGTIRSRVARARTQLGDTLVHTLDPATHSGTAHT